MDLSANAVRNQQVCKFGNRFQIAILVKLPAKQHGSNYSPSVASLGVQLKPVQLGLDQAVGRFNVNNLSPDRL